MSNVLVVDDDPKICDMLKDMLTRDGCEVDTAYCGKDALLKIKSEKPDLMLLDISMPGMDGIEVLRQMEKIDKSIPVIMVTGHQDIDDAKNAFRFGARDYVLKPFNIEYLKSSVFSMLSHDESKQQSIRDESVKFMISALKNENPDIRLWAIAALGEIKDGMAVQPLIECLKDGDWYVRDYAVSALGKIRDPKSLQSLRDMLRDDVQFVRQRVVTVLGEFGSPDVVDSLVPLLRDESWSVRKSVIEILGNAEDERSIAPIECMIGEEIDKDVKQAALDVLDKIKQKRSSVSKAG